MLKRLVTKLVASPDAGIGLTMTWIGVGVTACFVSAMIGLDSFSYKGHQVGYLAAINWSVVYAVFLPLILWLVIRFIRETHDVLRQLARDRMLCDKRENQIASEDDSDHVGRYVERLSKNLRLWVYFSILALVYTCLDWWQNSGGPLLSAKTAQELQADGVLIDWQVGAKVKDVGTALNATFTFFCYLLLQAVMYSVGFLFAVTCWSFSWFLDSLRSDNSVTVIPNLRSRDPRYGFEMFEGVSKTLTTISLLFFATFYCVVLNSQYMNGKLGDHASLLDGVLRPYASFNLAQLIEPVSTDPATLLAIVGSLVLIVTIFVFVLLVPNWLADSARSVLRQKRAHGELPAGLTEDELARAKTCEETMQTWPYQWLSLNRAFLFVIAAFGGIVVYRLFPALFVLALGRIGFAIYVQLKRRLP